MNKCIISGRLTKDVELRYTQGGKAVASFTLAVKRNFKNAQGEYESDFINCVAWGKTGELIANYSSKGQILPVSGRLQVRSYDKDGQKHYVSEIIVEEFDFPEKRQAAPSTEAYGHEVSMDSDVPF